MSLPIDVAQPELATFTVFCRQANNEGTTWIDKVQARNLNDAVHQGRVKCMTDWGYDHWQVSEVAVIGVAQGDVDILMWDDLEN